MKNKHNEADDFFSKFQKIIETCEEVYAEANHRFKTIKKRLQKKEKQISIFNEKAKYWLKKGDGEKAKEYLKKVELQRHSNATIKTDLDKLEVKNSNFLSVILESKSVLYKNQQKDSIYNDKLALSKLKLESAVNDLVILLENS